jgi:RNA polymerase sigma-70 factor (ECF subfamily)
MNEAQAQQDDSLPLSLELRIDALCQTFEAEWKRVSKGATPPRIEDLLDAVAEPERGPLLRELLKVELHYRRQERPSPDEFRRRFPKLETLIENLFGRHAKERAQAEIDPSAPGGVSPMHTTPVSLLEQLRHPTDQQAWERFAKLYTPLLFFWARRLGLAEADAADLVQDVFAVLVRKLPEFQYDQHRSFRGWLHTVMLNKWRDRCKKPNLPMESGGRCLEKQPAEDTNALFEEAEYRQRLVSRALELLQPDFQPVTWKAFWEHGVSGRPAATVAAELGISKGAVYSAKFRVMDRLRKELRGLTD